MTLLAQVARRLRSAGIPFSLIGAAAAALRGVSRATADIDLLTIDPAALDAALWSPLGAAGLSVEIRRGDAADPLAGIVRVTGGQDDAVDVVVGLGGWQADVLARAEPRVLDGVEIPVVTRADLILLKLYAGGPADRWDIAALRLASDDPGALDREVERGLARLPGRARRIWTAIREAEE